MSKRITKEEKKKIIVGYLHETKDVFLYKDLEAVISKKGIAPQAFKDVLKEIVDDGLVQCEKLGSSNYYWSFPSQAYKTSLANYNKLNEKNQTNIKKLEKLTTQLKELKQASDPDTQVACEAAKKDLLELTKQYTEVSDKLDQLKDFDPELVQVKESAIDAYKNAANRWTDNVFMIQSYCIKKFNMERNDFQKNFNIPADFDTFE